METQENELNDLLVRLNESAPMTWKRKALRFTWKWGRRVVGWGSLLVLIGVVCFVFWANYKGQQAIDTFEAQLAKRGIVANDTEPLKDSENGARIYLAALSILKELPETHQDATPIVGMANWPLLGESFTIEQAKHLQDIVVSNTAVYELCEHAREYSEFDYDWPVNEDIESPLSFFGPIRQIHRWLELKSLECQSRNDIDQAVQVQLGMFDFLNSLSGDNTLNAELSRMSLNYAAIETLQGLLSRFQLTEDQNNMIAKKVAASNHSFEHGKCIEADMLQALEICRNLKSNVIISEAKMLQNWEDNPIAIFLLQEMFKLDTGLDNYDVTSIKAWCGRTIQRQYAFFCPGRKQQHIIEKVRPMLGLYDQIHDAKTRNILKPDFILEYQYGESGTLGHPYAEYTIYQIKSGLMVCHAALQCELFRMKTGQWPASMTDIGDSVPLDAMGQPIRLLREETGIRVYTISADGKDDKGEWYGGSPRKDDRCFRLFDPEKRNAKPSLPHSLVRKIGGGI